MASLTSDKVTEFVRRIALDMKPSASLLEGQRELLRCGGILLRPLPLDSASHPGRLLLTPQLIHEEDDDADAMLEQMSACTGSDPQSVKILCASAASGTGKTHLAYAVGKRHAYVVMIRVALQGQAAGDPILSRPWAELYRLLFDIENAAAPIRRSCVEKAVELAKCAYDLMELLVHCYVEVTLLAVHAGIACGIDSGDRLRELVLRFHRNGIAEEIVCSLFLQHTTEHRAVQDIESSDGLCAAPVQGVDAAWLRDYCAELRERVAKLPAPTPGSLSTPLLLCFDEVGTLGGKLTELFVQRSAYTSVNTDASPERAVHTAAVPPPVSADSTWGRSWFFALACLMCDVTSKTRWCCFMTGTAFSIARFQTMGTVHSPVRGSISLINPTTRLNVSSMRAILQHYWDVSNAVLDDARIMKFFRLCVGRPLLFVAAVFEPMCNAMISLAACAPVREWTVDLLEPRLQRGTDDQAHVWAERLRLLLAGSRSLATGTGETTRALVPRLISAVLFEEPLSLVDANVLDAAIASGLLPAVAVVVGSTVPPQVIRVRDEPLVHRALSYVLDELIRSDHVAIMKLIFPPTHPFTHPSSAGFAVEQVVAVELALRTRRVRLLGPRPPSLEELLKPLFMGSRDTFPVGLDTLECRAEHAVSVRDWDIDTCVLRRFVGPDGLPDDSVVLYDLPTCTGLDVAFLVSTTLKPVATGAGGAASSGKGRDSEPGSGAERRCFRLAGFQLRNDADSSLRDVLRTLHPGTQYLVNKQRDALIARTGIVDLQPGKGASSPAWRDYVAFAEEHPQLVTQWVRVPTLARTIDAKVYEFACLAAAGRLPRGLLDTVLSALTVTHARAADAAAAAVVNSPVVFASLNSRVWLPDDLRRVFISEIDRVGSVMQLVKGSELWIPVPVADAVAAVCVAEDKEAKKAAAAAKLAAATATKSAAAAAANPATRK